MTMRVIRTTALVAAILVLTGPAFPQPADGTIPLIRTWRPMHVEASPPIACRTLQSVRYVPLDPALVPVDRMVGPGWSPGRSRLAAPVMPSRSWIRTIPAPAPRREVLPGR